MTLSISQVAATTGLRPSALRYYEEAGLITPAGRHGGRRHYDHSVLPRLGMIALCQNAGFTIAEIGQLLDDRPDAEKRWHDMAEKRLDEIDAKIAQLETMRSHLEAALACECGRVEGCELVDAARDHRRAAHQAAAHQAAAHQAAAHR